MNFPNKLTLLRVLMIPVYLVVMLAVPWPVGPLVGAAIYALASATDAIDGWAKPLPPASRPPSTATWRAKTIRSRISANSWIPLRIKCW